MQELNRLYAGFLGLPPGRTDPAAVKEASLSALCRSLQWAKDNSPFYRERLKRVNPDRLRSLDDLAGLPFTTAEDLADRPQDLLCLSQSQVERVITVHTSGSSGAAKRVYFTKSELEDTAEFFRCGLNDLLGPESTVLALLPHDTPDGAGHLLGRALKSGGRPIKLIWPLDDLEQTARWVRDNQPGCLVGLPVHILNLAEKVGPGAAGAALFCSEYVPESLRRRVESALGAPSYIHYGSTECGLGGAVECSPKSGCHVRADIIWEVVQPGGDRVCRPGEAGELVITTLRRRAMPLIRYRTKDLVRMSETPCSCGGLGPRLVWLGGRLEGARLEGGDALRQAELDEALFSLPAVKDFRIYLIREAKDKLHTDYVSARPGSDLGPKIIKALEQVPAIARSLDCGGLTLAPPQSVSGLAASHTIKRVVTDQRH